MRGELGFEQPHGPSLRHVCWEEETDIARCLWSGAIHASASSYVKVDDNCILGNNFAKIDGGEEGVGVRRGTSASNRLASKNQPRYTATKIQHGDVISSARSSQS